MPKDNQNDTRGLQDVELYFKQIQAVIKSYKRLVEKLEPIAHDKKKVDEKLELLVRELYRGNVSHKLLKMVEIYSSLPTNALPMYDFHLTVCL